MKKVLIFILTIFVFLLTSCGDKTALTSNEFKTMMEKNNFDIHDITEQFKDPVKTVVIAANDKYTIEYYEMNTTTNALDNYTANVDYFKENKEDGSMITETSNENDAKYTETSSTKYNIISRIGSTYIYCSTDLDNKDEVNNYFEELGY